MDNLFWSHFDEVERNRPCKPDHPNDKHRYTDWQESGGDEFHMCTVCGRAEMRLAS